MYSIRFKYAIYQNYILHSYLVIRLWFWANECQVAHHLLPSITFMVFPYKFEEIFSLARFANEKIDCNPIIYIKWLKSLKILCCLSHFDIRLSNMSKYKFMQLHHVFLFTTYVFFHYLMNGKFIWMLCKHLFWDTTYVVYHVWCFFKN